jgi:TolB-like protein/Flp pilus assembly protein TadD
MARLHARLLGGFEFNDEDGGELRLATRKARALLAFLIVEADKWHTRDQLADLLWSDRQQTQARHSLTQTLGTIRKLGQSADTPLIEADSERVRLSAAAIDSDVLSFRKNLKTNPNTAAECYDGPLLDRFVAPDEAFDQWLTAERASFHNVACSALSWAVDQAEANNDLTAAISAATRLEALDPYAETSHRQLMRLYVATGNRGDAIRQYESCRQMLAKELGIEPSAETTALLEVIRSSNEFATDRQIKAEKVAANSQTLRKAAVSETSAPLPLPNKPSIAVLPFENLSSDPEQDYLADGIADDVITGLSKFRSLFVIARSSSFSFKGVSTDVRQIASELGVRYVLQGSLRKAGDRIRVTGQLVDAETGKHMWADRFDDKLKDLFAVQDQITSSIIQAIEPEIGKAERDRARRKPPDNLDAWSLYQRALTAYFETREEKLVEATTLFDRLNEIEPGFAPGFAMAADTRSRLVVHYRSNSAPDLLKEASKKATIALALDAEDPVSLWADGRVKTMCHEYDQAVPQIERAIALNPNYAMAYHALGFVLTHSGDSERAIEQQDTAIRLSPNDAFMSGFCSVKGECLLRLGRYEEALITAYQAIGSPNPRYWAYACLAAAAAELGRQDEAGRAAADLMALKPDFLEHVGLLAHSGQEFWVQLFQRNGLLNK